MHIVISAIGKLKKNTPEYDIMANYFKRIKWPISVKEYEAQKGLSGNTLKSAEGRLLLSGLDKETKIVVLDEHGSTLTSREFASHLRKWQNMGVESVAFLVGGADGHSEEVKKQADLTLSFGRMTLPHFLMRVVLAEQLYRAQTIFEGHPYHRD